MAAKYRFYNREIPFELHYCFVREVSSQISHTLSVRNPCVLRALPMSLHRRMKALSMLSPCIRAEGWMHYHRRMRALPPKDAISETTYDIEILPQRHKGTKKIFLCICIRQIIIIILEAIDKIKDFSYNLPVGKYLLRWFLPTIEILPQRHKGTKKIFLCICIRQIIISIVEAINEVKDFSNNLPLGKYLLHCFLLTISKFFHK